MENINGDQMIIHLDEEGQAHMHRVRNPAEALNLQLAILLNRAFTCLWQRRFGEVCLQILLFNNQRQFVFLKKKVTNQSKFIFSFQHDLAVSTA